MDKSQIAMEFLMTYSWVILIVLAAMGALAYFGVLTPQNILPERTEFSGPLANLDNAVVNIDGHTVEVVFKNNKGMPITIPKTSSFESPQCTSASLDNVTNTITHVEILPNEQIANGDTFMVSWTCNPSGATKPGDKITADIAFDYTNVETGQTFKETGSIQGKWN